MAISSYGVTLMKGTGTTTVTYSKLVDIKDFPDLGGAPEMLETTTLSDAAQTYINGIQQMKAMEFTANYTKDDYDTLKALTGTNKFALFFGTDGTNGKFGWDGELSVYPAGGKVNSVVEMKISISPSTVIAPITA
jgi:hypothetical protein